LIGLLRRLRPYVEENCRNDLSVLLSSGFQAAVTTRMRSVMKCGLRQSARITLLVPGKPPECSTNSRSMTIDGLTPTTTYMFQVRAIGGSTRYSDWSNPVSHMCV